jgi:hypothetical protein
MPARSGFFGHCQQVLARDLADEVGMVPVDVFLGVPDEFVVGIAANDLAALTVD